MRNVPWLIKWLWSLALLKGERWKSLAGLLAGDVAVVAVDTRISYIPVVALPSITHALVFNSVSQHLSLKYQVSQLQKIQSYRTSLRQSGQSLNVVSDRRWWDTP